MAESWSRLKTEAGCRQGGGSQSTGCSGGQFAEQAGAQLCTVIRHAARVRTSVLTLYAPGRLFMSLLVRPSMTSAKIAAAFLVMAALFSRSSNAAICKSGSLELPQPEGGGPIGT